MLCGVCCVACAAEGAADRDGGRLRPRGQLRPDREGAARLQRAGQRAASLERHAREPAQTDRAVAHAAAHKGREGGLTDLHFTLHLTLSLLTRLAFDLCRSSINSFFISLIFLNSHALHSLSISHNTIYFHQLSSSETIHSVFFSPMTKY